MRRRHIRGFTLGLRRIKLTEYVYSKSVNYWTYTLDASIRPAYSSDHWGCVEFRRNYNPIKIYIIRQLNQWRQINHSFSHINLIKHMHSIVTISDKNVLRNFWLGNETFSLVIIGQHLHWFRKAGWSAICLCLYQHYNIFNFVLNLHAWQLLLYSRRRTHKL